MAPPENSPRLRGVYFVASTGATHASRLTRCIAENDPPSCRRIDSIVDPVSPGGLVIDFFWIWVGQESFDSPWTSSDVCRPCHLARLGPRSVKRRNRAWSKLREELSCRNRSPKTSQQKVPERGTMPIFSLSHSLDEEACSDLNWDKTEHAHRSRGTRAFRDNGSAISIDRS
jgi:hypothetical protein